MLDRYTNPNKPILRRVFAGEVSDPQGTTLEILETANADARYARTLADLIEGGALAGASVFWPLGQTGPSIIADVLRLTPWGRQVASDA